jgi:hypothetical protein
MIYRVLSTYKLYSSIRNFDSNWLGLTNEENSTSKDIISKTLNVEFNFVKYIMLIHSMNN